MTDTPYNRKIQNFLEEYCNFSPDNFYVNGMMKKGAVKEAVRLLIEEIVFSSVKDMRLQALKCLLEKQSVSECIEKAIQDYKENMS